MSKRHLNQPLQQSRQLQRHGREWHYSDQCQCRTCRRLRAKRSQKAGGAS